MITVKKSEYNKAKLRKLFREASQQYIQITDEEAQELGLIEQTPTGPTGEQEPETPTGNTEPQDPTGEEGEHDYSKDYLTFETARKDDDYINVKFSEPGLLYSINNGNTWQELQKNVYVYGKKILFKSSSLISYDTGIGSFYSDRQCNVYGNIMSLLYGDNFNNKYTLYNENQFCLLFGYNDNIINANNLILPATTLTHLCYSDMFKECTSLKTAPKLPAINLAGGCYDLMFYGCSSLIAAPELLASQLMSGCYQWMFEKCYKLNYIKCLADVNNNTRFINYFKDWIIGVSKTGTFVKHKNAQWEIGPNGIPEGWEIIEVEE